MRSTLIQCRFRNHFNVLDGVLRLLRYPARLSFLMIRDDNNLPCLNFVMHPHLAEEVNLLCLVHVYLCERSGRVTGSMHMARTADSCVLISAV